MLSHVSDISILWEVLPEFKFIGTHELVMISINWYCSSFLICCPSRTWILPCLLAEEELYRWTILMFKSFLPQLVLHLLPDHQHFITAPVVEISKFISLNFAFVMKLRSVWQRFRAVHAAQTGWLTCCMGRREIELCSIIPCKFLPEQLKVQWNPL